jgi:hypothetical protein
MKTMFPCPACHHQLQPPSQASRSARLRCPICHHELEAFQLLLGINRPWLVIEDPGGENVFAPFHEATVADTPLASVGTEPAAKDSSSTDATEELQLASGDNVDEARSINWEKFQPVSHEEFQRRRRKEDSPIKMLIQIVLGGVVAVPVALLIMWHFLGRDIGGAAPWVASFAPWIVPESMRPLQDSDGVFPPRRVPLPDKGWIDREMANGNAIGAERSSAGQGRNDAESAANQPSELSKDEKIRSMQAKVEPNVPILDALNALEKAMDAWMVNSSNDIEIKRPLALNYYASAASVAKAVESLSETDPTTRVWEDRVGETLKRIVTEPKLLKLLASGGKHAVQSGLQQGEGLVCQITVRDSDLEGDAEVKMLDPFAADASRVRFSLPSKLIGFSGEWLVLSVVESGSDSPTARILQAVPIPSAPSGSSTLSPPSQP